MNLKEEKKTERKIESKRGRKEVVLERNLIQCSILMKHFNIYHCTKEKKMKMSESVVQQDQIS